MQLSTPALQAGNPVLPDGDDGDSARFRAIPAIPAIPPGSR
jgi:hypothetical protein